MNILCKLGIHKWNKHPKIENRQNSFNANAIYMCDRCKQYEKTVCFNRYTSEVYRTYVLPKI